jgi:hypothetical protein
MEKESNVPASAGTSSVTHKFQTPLGFCELLNPFIDWNGEKVPKNGAAPELTEPLAPLAAKQVFEKLSPLPPLLLASKTIVPEGEVSLIFKSLSYVWVRLIQTCVIPKVVSILVGKPLTVTGKQVCVLLSGIAPPVELVNV